MSDENSVGTVTAIYRYPVKGMAPDTLSSAKLEAGEAIPFDRAWAIENGPGRFDPTQPRHLPKINFVMLMRDERLASLQSQFEEETQTLTIFRVGRQVARGQLSTQLGRRMLEQFFAAYLGDTLRGAPKIVSAAGHTFSDVDAKCLHIINLASVQELERISGRAINPLRFRPNLVVDGLKPWEEFSFLEQDISIGSATFNVFSRTQRCAATNVDPETAERDLALPELLQRTWQHTDFGIYARVKASGDLQIGDAIARA